jgi:hypothetical protein
VGYVRTRFSRQRQRRGHRPAHPGHLHAREAEIILLPPTYGMYEVSASINDVPLVKVPLTPDFG